MKISIIQAPLVWENPEANRQYFSEKINSIEQTDLIVLPEMFSTGFTMNPERGAETMQGETITWMKALAQIKNCAVTGSIVVLENENYYNRLFFIFPTGDIVYYNKRHLFSLAGEDKVYTAGKEKTIVEYLGWKINLLICYDLRFPVFSRNVNEEYDVLIYVANWPTVRIEAWDILLKARAVENMSYVVGVNRIGKDNNDYDHCGHSQIVDFMGNYIAAPVETESSVTVTLDKEQLTDARKKFGFLNDSDSFNLTD